MKKLLYTLIFLAITNVSFAGWSIVNIGTTNEFTSVKLSNAQIFYATAINPSTYEGFLFKSTNGGANWFQLPLPSNFMAPYVCYIGSDGTNGFVTGTSIIKTSNGGVNWISAYTPTDTVVFFGADIQGSPKAFWAVGNKSSGSGLGVPVVVRCPSFFSSNVYTRITMPSNMTGYQLTCVSALDSNSCVIGVNRGSDPGVILKTTNKGVNWTTFTMPSGIGIWTIDMDGGGGGWAAGGNNGVYHLYWTGDWGTTWSLISSGNSGQIKGLHYFSGNGAFAVGSNGVILRNYGGPTFWTPQNSGVMVQLNSISVLGTNENIVYAVGENGIMLKTTDGGIGIQKISSEVPSSFTLHQNYPNPFNPVTNIKFDIQKSSDVKIIISDVMGREITTLVNEQLKPGTYEVDWDAINYPSGVYFYSLTASDFVETRKMILIK
jgi:photosystem II stability/assembly factor-like uncharacterized protein